MSEEASNRDPGARQQQRNQATRDAWERFAAHRGQVTRLLRSAAPPQGGSLCVWGAGNCNDLDLPALLERFRDIELADLDAEALTWGAAQQGFGDEPRLKIRTADVSGVATELARLTPQSPADDPLLQACLEKIAATATSEPAATYDVAASVCLLTQLIETVVLAVGERHPRFAELALGVRNAHLGQLLGLSRPGGAAVLITDVVSSDTCPDLPGTPPAALPAKLAGLINSRNFFTGANPVAIRNVFETDARLASQVARAELSDPWLWDFGPRVYAVCAVVVRCRDRH